MDFLQPRTPEDQIAALDLLCSHFSEHSRAEQVHSLASSSLEGLFTALDDARLIGAVLAVPLAGRAGLVLPPRTQGRRGKASDIALRARLIEAACDFLQTHGAVLAQSALPEFHGPDADAFTRAGFEHVAEMLCLAAEPSAAGVRHEAPDADLFFSPCLPPDDARLRQLIDRTYHNSLDCPLLTGQRDVADALAGYRAVGRFDPSTWFCVQDRGGGDIGCLLLNEHADEVWELVYMGLVPSARGRGLGRRIVEFAMRTVQHAGGSRLMTAVDAANHPAIVTYSRCGFTEWDRKSAFVRFLAPPAR